MLEISSGFVESLGCVKTSESYHPALLTMEKVMPPSCGKSMMFELGGRPLGPTGPTSKAIDFSYRCNAPFLYGSNLIGQARIAFRDVPHNAFTKIKDVIRTQG